MVVKITELGLKMMQSPSGKLSNHLLPVSKGRALRLIIILVLSLGGGQVVAANNQTPSVTTLNAGNSPERFFKASSDAVAKGDYLTASQAFIKFYDLYPQHEKAEQSLLSAARLSKKAALQSDKPDWETVRDIYRRFYTDFPQSSFAPETYLEMGIALFHMHALREAKTYFNIFLERYPRSPLAEKALYWKSKTLFAIGHDDEAEEVAKQLMRGRDKELRSDAGIILWELYYKRGHFTSALAVCEQLLKETPHQSPRYFDLLRFQGTTLVRMEGAQNKEKGRELLYQYLNVVEDEALRNQVLFELAETYYREDNDTVAQKLYSSIIASGKEEDRSVVLSRFRQAQYYDDPNRELEKWQKRGDLHDPAGDTPYLAVLNTYFDELISQDARYGLFLRYMARKDYEQAYQVGKSFLQFGAQKGKLLEETNKTVSGDVLVLLVEKLLQNREYKKIYDLYVTQHDYVNEYKQGRLQYLVGQALEAMHLYNQAAVVYYRALGLSLTKEEKVDLYYRRAAVYLAKKDWASADRLLTYLREIYKGKKEIGEVYYYSGRLEEAAGDREKALTYYEKAVEIQTLPARKESYADALLQSMFVLEKYDNLREKLLSFAQQEAWLSPQAQQEWYEKVGEAYFQKKEYGFAEQMLLAAIGKGMPEETIIAQNAHLRLGDLYNLQGDREKSRQHYSKAREGEDRIQQKIAIERLKQDEIDQVLREVGNILGK